MSASSQPPPAGDTGARTRVLVIDRSAELQAALSQTLSIDPTLEIAGWAASGAPAVKAVQRLRPDVIALGVRGADRRAVEATRHIMHESPTPIIAFVLEGSDTTTEQALLAAGALAVVPRTVAGTSGEAGKEAVRTLKTMARVRVIRRPSPERAGLGGTPDRPAPAGARRGEAGAAGAAGSAPAGARRAPEVVVIGASTGGPQALEELLAQLPADYPLPVLVVQHIAAGFADSLVAWLHGRCRVPVRLATAGQPVRAPGVYVAPTDRHLVVRGRTLALTTDPPVKGHRPSATVLFRSAAREYGGAAAGVLLSGMGEDGAAGLRDLKAAGATTFAQDQASSAVFGMPAAAIGLGVVDHVLPPPAIGSLLAGLPWQSAGRAHTSAYSEGLVGEQ